MRYCLAILFFLFVFCNYSMAQNAPKYKGRISGKVTDSLTKAPVDYATVSVYKEGNTNPLNGISTDEKGNFVVGNLPPGNYRVTFDFMGYKRKTLARVSITDAAPSVALGNMLLASSVNQLKTVSIVGKAPVMENKIDKLVYNAANDLTSQGGVALDVLKKVPMVTVDIDGNVELQGNASIRFLINGKPSSIFGASLSDALQAIPASQIKSIEVITSPGAKYDAAGTGGIINIILKDSKIEGFNGSVNASAGTRLENGSLNLSVRKNNIGLNGYFNGNEQLNTTTLSSSHRTSYNNTRDTISNLQQDGSGALKRSGYQGGLSFNWSISKKDELTASVGFNHFGNNNSGLTAQDQINTGLTNNVISNVMSLRNSSSDFHNNSTDFSVDYKKSFKKEGQELDIQYNTGVGRNNSNVFQEQNYQLAKYPSTGSMSVNPGRQLQTNISVDYAQPINDNVKLEVGAKTVIETLTSNTVTDTLLANGSYVLNPNQSYGFTYHQHIYAGYASLSAALFNKFLEAKAGLRYERTDNTIDYAGAQIPGYNTFAPSFVLLHKLDQTQSIKASYSFRIERPGYGDLNPFYNVSDPHNISTGNPELRPEIGHNYELGYNKSFDKGGNIYVGAVYRYNTDDLQSYTTFYPVLTVNGVSYSNVSLSYRYNIGSQTSIGANIFGSMPVTDKLNLRTNIQLGDRSNSNPGNATVNSFAYRVNLNATYEFSNNLVAEIFGNYNSSQKTIQGTRPAFGFYNMAVRRQFWNKKASIGLTAANPFNQYVNQRSTTSGTNFDQYSLRQVPFRSFGISLSYKFGKLEFKKDKDKDDNNNMPGPIDNGK